LGLGRLVGELADVFRQRRDIETDCLKIGPEVFRQSGIH